MTKLIIQIPCYNEEKNIGITIPALPKKIKGIDVIETLIVDDGSTDNTIASSKSFGVDHIVCLQKHQGLSSAFMAGIKACLEKGADIIVNTDADNQYDAAYITELIQPILNKNAEIVIGSRSIEETAHFSYIKKKLQRFGSWVVRVCSNTDVPDATSGFRAFSRKAAMKLNVFSNYTYTLETIIQAGQKGIPIISVPVKTNPPLRPSRLITSTPAYIYFSIVTIIRIFVVYRPFRFLASIGTIMFFLGSVLGFRFLYFYFFTASKSGHIQSLILTAILIIMGFQVFISAFLADLISVNRKMLEDLKHELNNKKEIK